MIVNHLVSIIVRTKDRPKLLKRALQSISVQTYRPIEVVLVNDGGCDLDIEEIKSILGDISLNYIRLEKNTGRAHAGNVGIENSKGEYIGFLDDDDELYLGHVETLITFLRQSDYKVAYTDTEMVFVEFSPEEGKIVSVSKAIFSRDFSYSNLLIGNYIPLNSICFSREVLLSATGFDEDYDLYEDWDLLIRIGQKHPFYHIKKITAIYHQWSRDLQINQAQAEHMRAMHLKVIGKHREKITPENILNIKYEKEGAESELNSLREILREKDSHISQLKETVREKDSYISQLNETVRERNIRISQLEETINLIKDTLGWRAIEKFRRLREKTLPQGSRRRRIYDLGIRSVKVISQEGFRVFLEKVRRKKKYKNRSPKISGIFLVFSEAVKNPGLARKFIFTVRLYGFKNAYQRLKNFCYKKTNEKIETKSFYSINEHHIAYQFDGSTTLEKLSLSSIDIAKYDNFFFDVFDTAIIRLFIKPVDLFRYIAFKKNEKDFYIRRIKKENMARMTNPLRRDISISDIYNDLGDGSALSEEIEAEFKFCVANPEILRFYTKLVQSGKKVFFISDMYLDKSTINDILTTNGYLKFEDIFVSSVDDVIKGDGSRFEWLKQTYPDTMGRSIMIGDNIIADVKQPKIHGYDAFHYIGSDAYYKYERFINSKIDFINSKDSLGLSFILSMFRYWKLGFNEESPSYWRQFGLLYGGALVSSFCQFIHNYILNNNFSCNRIFFLGRDGDIMNQVYKLLYDCQSDIEPINLLVSRRSVVFPSLTTFKYADDMEELNQFTIPYHITGPKDIMERLGYSDLYELESDLNNLGSDPSRWSQDDIYKCLRKNKEKIMEKVKSERKVLFDYLERNKVFEQDDLIIIDVGWRGSIQNALVKLFDIWGYSNINISGIYMGVNTEASQKIRMKGYLYDRNQREETEFRKYSELIELICSSPMEPIERIDYINGHFVPVNKGTHIYEKKRQLISSDIQRGIIDFAEIVKKRNIDLGFILQDDFKTLFGALQDFASIDDIRQIGQLRHSMTVGNDYSLPILDFNNNLYNLYKVRYDIKIISVFVNEEMYKEYFINNSFVNGYDLIGIDNRELNLGLPKIYNEIINEFINESCWLFFCHEDLKVMSDLKIFDELDPHCIYGTFGVKIHDHCVPVAYGKHTCSNKDGSNPIEVGIEIENPVTVQTLDCQSVLVHTSLLKIFPKLRFDEHLSFDLYVEDFCINAQENFKIDIKVFPLKFWHYSHGKTTQRYYEGLNYLAQKYPNVGVAGSCSFIGGRADILEEKFTYDIPANRDYMSKKRIKNNENH